MSRKKNRTDIRIFDEPCGSGKSSKLIDELQYVKEQGLKGCTLLVVPYLSEVERFQDVIGSNWLISPVDGKGRKIDQLIDAMGKGRNIITTHALYEQITKISHLLHKYDVIIDEVPTTTKQIPVYFGKVEFNELIKDNYIKVDSKTNLLTVTEGWQEIVAKYNRGDSKDKRIAKFITQVANTEVYKMNGTYCLMPLPEAFFTEPKHLVILTFMFRGTQLDHYMKKRGYKYKLYQSVESLAVFKRDMFRNIEFYPITSKAKTGFVALSGSDPKHRKTVGNFVVKAIKHYRSLGRKIEQSDILVGSHKDAWFGKSDPQSSRTSKVSDRTCFRKLTKLSGATYTPIITRGTNAYSDKTVLLMLGTENLNPNVAAFLGMDNTIAENDHRLSELIQLIYRTAIRKGQKIIFICPDDLIIALLKCFIGYERKQELHLRQSIEKAIRTNQM